MWNARLLPLLLVAGLSAGCTALGNGGGGATTSSDSSPPSLFDDSGSSTSDQVDEWKVLGRHSVGFATTRDAFDVSGFRKKFNFIKFKVKENGIDVSDIRVTFQNGDTFMPEVKSHLNKDAETREIDLPKKDRTLERVEITYRSTNPKMGKAIVSLYGK